MAASQDRLGQATEQTAQQTEQAARRQLSAGAALEKLRREVDETYRTQQRLERGTATLNRAYQQGIIDAATYERTMGQLTNRYSSMAAAAANSTTAVRSATAAWRELGTQGAATLGGLETARARAEANAAASRRLGGLGGAAANENAAGRRLRSDEVTNLVYQGSDIASQLGSGSPLGMIALQQGPQIAQVFAGPGGASIKGALSQAGDAVGGFASRIGLLGGAIGGAATATIAAVVAQQSYASTQLALARSTAGIGRASGMTVGGINALALSSADGAGLSVRSARELLGQYAGTGGIRSALAGSLLGTARDYAATTGQDLTEANKALAAAFADPTRGAKTLNDQLGFLNATTLETIKRLDAQGDRLGAQRALFDAYKTSLTSATELTSGWGHALESTGNRLSNFWDKVGRAVDRATTGGDLETRLATARRALAEAERDNAGSTSYVQQLITGPRIATFRGDVERLEAEQRRIADDAAKRQAAQDSLRTAEQLKTLNEGLKSAQLGLQTSGYSQIAASVARINSDFDKRLETTPSDGRAILEQTRQVELDRLRQETYRSEGRYSRSIGQVPSAYRDFYYDAATRYGLDPNLLAAQGYQESRFNPNAVSPAGAQGIAQFMPGTARQYGLTNPLDPASAIDAQARLMRDLLAQFGGNETLALIGYNAGPRRAQRFQESGGDLSTLPAETRGYLRDILTPRANTQQTLQEEGERTRQLQQQRDELRLTTEAGGRDTEGLRARTDALRSITEAQGRGITVSQALASQYAQEATERQRIISAGRFLAFSDNDNFARAQLGRDRLDQQAYAAARPFAGTRYEQAVLDQTRETLRLTEAKDMASGALTDFATQLSHGGDALQAFSNIALRIGDRLISSGIDSLVSAGFSAGGGGGIGGFFSSLFGGGGGASDGLTLALGGADDVFGGFARGGYTGHGGRFQPAGIVHRGEVVWSQDDVARVGGVAVAEAMRRGLPGYASGGPVGWAKPSAGMGGGIGTIDARTTINAPGADAQAVADLKAYVDARDRALPQRIRELQKRAG
ncbi:phage tail length tape measure family protein [Methylorubrum rhodinum]